MSLLPYFFDDYRPYRPTMLQDQHFGGVLDPDDFLQFAIPRHVVRHPAGYHRNWRPLSSEKDAGSVVSYDRDRFTANLDVQQFKPEEISVKVTGENTVTIEGKHEEKEDEHGLIYRHFVRKYVLPKTYDIDSVESKLSSDGVLTVTAPKVGGDQIEHKTIPVKQTGEPVAQIKQSQPAEVKK